MYKNEILPKIDYYEQTGYQNLPKGYFKMEPSFQEKGILDYDRMMKMNYYNNNNMIMNNIGFNGNIQTNNFPEYDYLYNNIHNPLSLARPYLHLNKNYQEYNLHFPYEIDPPYLHFDHKRPRLVPDPYKYSIFLKFKLRTLWQQQKIKEMRENLLLEEQKLMRLYGDV